MKIYCFMKKEYEDEFVRVEKTDENRIGLEPKANASKELIQSIYRFNLESEDSSVLFHAKELSNRMIEKFKSSECYLLKSDAERQEIIQFLIDNPDVNTPGVD